MGTSPAERTLESVLAGKEISFDYSETWVAYSILALRVVMGYVILSAGLGKLAEEGWTNPGGFSAEAFLVHGVDEANPLKDMYVFFADHLWLVDPLVMWTQILIGLALVFGVFLRLAAFGGALQMIFFWIGAWEGGLMAGLPVAHGYLIDSSFVYALVLFGLGAWGAGRILGLDAWLEETAFVQQNPWVRYILG